MFIFRLVKHGHGGERNDTTLYQVFSEYRSICGSVVVAFIIAEKATTTGEEVRVVMRDNELKYEVVECHAH